MKFSNCLMLLGVILILGVVGVGPSESQDEGADSNAPFLYYFSEDRQAFVIERADGSDGRLLGEGVMAQSADKRNIVIDRAWSVSGEWLAWVVSVEPNERFSGIPSYQHLHIVAADGGQPISLTDDYDAVTMAWSPVEDVVFVVTEKIETKTDFEAEEDTLPYITEIDLEFLLIDVAAGDVQSIWQSHEVYGNTLYDGGDFRLNWTPDGDQIAVTLRFSYYSPDYGWMINQNGDVREFSGEESIRSRVPALHGYGLYTLSPTFNRIYLEDDLLWVESVLDQTRQSFEAVPAEDVIWTNDGDYAILAGETGVWLLSLPDGEITLIDENMQLRLQSFVYTPSMWSIDGNYAILQNEEGQVFHFDRVTQTLSQLDDVQLSSQHFDFYWQWVTDETIAISGGNVSDSDEVIIAVYNFASGDVDTFDLNAKIAGDPNVFWSGYTNQFMFTSDGRRLAFVSVGAVILDVEPETTIVVRPAYDSYFSVSGGEVFWHEDEEWLLVYEDGLIAGGAYIRYSGVLSADGSIRQDLGKQLDWLPSQVDPDNLPPVSPTPIFPQPFGVIHDDEWSFYASWSPDGGQIAVGLSRWFLGSTPIHVWDLETEAVEIAFDDVEYDQIIEWETDASGGYVPVVADSPFLDDQTEYRTQVISPDGQYVARWDGSENLSVYALDNLVAGELVAEIPISGNSITAISYSPDGRLVAFGSQWTRVEIWETETWTQVARLPNPGAGIAFSPDGATLAVTISWDIQLWDVGMLVGEE